MRFERFDPLPDQPRDVARFEQLMMLSLLTGGGVAVIMSSHVARHIGRETGFVLLAGVFAGGFVLTLLASRRASRIARWLLAIGTVAALLPWLAHVPGMIERGLVIYLSLLQLGLQVAAIGYLFTASSRAWFTRRPYQP